MGELNVKHHTLIQALLSRGPLLEKEFQSIFFTLTGKNPGSHHQLFNEYLRKINKELAYVQFELRGCRNQYDGKVYYGVVNNVADEQSKFGTKYSVTQIAFYKAVIEAIVHDPTAQGSISNIDALNLRLEDQTGQGLEDGQSNVPTAFKNFSISQKEKSLHDFIRDRWLCSTPSGNIGLGVRSFLDLRSWFRSNDIPSCDICNEAGVKADLCSNEGCTIRIHDYCLKKKFSQTRVEVACPGCGTKWQCPNLSEEEENEGSLPTQSQGPPSSARPIITRKLRNSKIEQVSPSEAAPQLTVKPDPDLPRRTRRSSRLL